MLMETKVYDTHSDNIARMKLIHEKGFSFSRGAESGTFVAFLGCGKMLRR